MDNGNKWFQTDIHRTAVCFCAHIGSLEKNCHGRPWVSRSFDCVCSRRQSPYSRRRIFSYSEFFFFYCVRNSLRIVFIITCRVRYRHRPRLCISRVSGNEKNTRFNINGGLCVSSSLKTILFPTVSAQNAVFFEIRFITRTKRNCVWSEILGSARRNTIVVCRTRSNVRRFAYSRVPRVRAVFRARRDSDKSPSRFCHAPSRVFPDYSLITLFSENPPCQCSRTRRYVLTSYRFATIF